MRLLSLLTSAALLVLLVVACNQDSGQVSSPAAVEEPTPVEAPVRPDLVSLVEGPVSPDGLKAILGTADLAVGVNRLGFVLTSPDGFVTEPAVTVSSNYYPTPGSEGEPKENARMQFQRWPYGNRGLYTARLNFDTQGSWGLDITVEDLEGSRRKAQLFFEVVGSTSAPAEGSPAVRSRSKTVADVETPDQLTTGSLYDEDLYQTTIADAVGSGAPTVVVFASPAFCSNAVCGPQVEVLQQLKDKYKGQANFIHVDFYDNPDEIQGDLDRARISPAVLEWRLPSIEWSFVIDRQGNVAARFEAFATLEEMEEALRRVL